MRILIVSDLHLTSRFEKRRFDYLKELFSSVDRIILNGDFWDGYRTTFDKFISSKWSSLFPLLKVKGAIYLYGNHDQKRYSDNRVSLFSSIQKDNFLLAVGKNIYHIEHGHLLSPTIDTKHPYLPKKTFTLISIITQSLEHMLIRVKQPHTFFIKGKNAKIKQKLKDKKHPFWYICGHTHFAEVDRENKFANSGSIQFGEASYLIVDNNEIVLKSERYR